MRAGGVWISGAKLLESYRKPSDIDNVMPLVDILPDNVRNHYAR